MNSKPESNSQLRAESWGTKAEGGSPTLPSNDSCRRCDDAALSAYSLCQACFAQLPDELCTAHVVDALGR